MKLLPLLCFAFAASLSGQAPEINPQLQVHECTVGSQRLEKELSG